MFARSSWRSMTADPVVSATWSLSEAQSRSRIDMLMMNSRMSSGCRLSTSSVR